MKVLGGLFHLRPKRELKELYFFTLLYSFASSLILIFEPIFFYAEGFSLAIIACYYAAHYLLYLILLPGGAMFAGKFGLERSLAVSMPLFIIYFLMLASVPKMPELFYLAWIVLTIFKTFFWPAYHAEISKFGDSKNRGTEISWFYAISRGAGVLGPMIGGLIITAFGFPVLFVLTAGLALFSVVPLLRTKERFRPRSIKYSDPWKIIWRRKEIALRWGMAGWGSHFINTVFWPIFMFIVLGAANVLGFLVSLNVLVMTLLGFFVGEMSDRWSRRKVIRMHMPFFALGCLLRPLAYSPVSVLLIDLLAKTSFIGVHIPMWHRLYSRAEDEGPLNYATAIEIMVCVYKVIAAVIVAGIFMVALPYTGFVLAFVLAAVFGMFFIWI
jgi:MFS family permease